MAELETADTPEIDVDAMSDEDFAAFKSGMMEGEQPAPDEPEPKPEENAAAEPQNEAQAVEDDTDDDDQPQRSETVSFDRFHRTNERRKEAERKASEEAEKRIRLEERLQALLDVQQQAQPKPEQAKKPEDDIPDDNDPVAIVNWAKKELLARKQREAEEAQQRESQTREQQEWKQVISTVQKDYSTSLEKDPSLAEAHNAWRHSLGQELLAMGYSQAEAVEEVNKQENAHIRHVYQTKQNVGEYIKKMAGIRGWAPKPAEAAAPDPEKDMQTIAKLEEARQASISLGKTGGAAAEIGKITPQQLADMTDEDFAAYKEKYGSVVHAFS